MSTQVEMDLVVLNSAMLPETEDFYRKHCRKVFYGRNGRSYILRLLWLIKTALICRMGKYNAVYTNGQGNSVGMFLSLLGGHAQWIHHHHMAGDSKDQQTWTPGYRKTLSAATTIIACSRKNALDMEKALGRIIDTIPCFSRKVTVPEGIEKSAEKIRFGYYGRLIPEKGIDHLCRLSEEADMNNAEFHIWGEGSAYPAAYFEKYKNLHYHGTFQGQEELARLIGSLDAFLLLSVHPEGLPICLLEAMSAGLPWLATDKGGIPDIAIDPNSTRVISENSDYDEIKTAVKSFANDISRGDVSKVAQQELYMKKFSAAALTKRWLSAFEIAEQNN